MELILNRHDEQLFVQFQAEWLGKWVPAIVAYAQKRKKDLSCALDGRCMVVQLDKFHVSVVQGFTCTMYSQLGYYQYVAYIFVHNFVEQSYVQCSI